MFKKILIPTDGSALATQAALEGIELAKKVGAEVVCIFVAGENQTAVFDFAHVKTDNHWPSNEEYERAVKGAAREFMTPVREAATAAGITLTEQTYISNSPALYIVSAAEKNGCDLIYMASRGRAGWAVGAAGGGVSVPDGWAVFSGVDLRKSFIRVNVYNLVQSYE